MNKQERYIKAVNISAKWAAGIGVPGSIFPPLDMAAMTIIWVRLVRTISKISGHGVNWAFATKLIYGITAGSVLYIGGSKLVNALLHAIPGAGTVTAAGANSIFNYIYTKRLGRMLVVQFDSPGFTEQGVLSMAKMAASAIFVGITAGEIAEAHSVIGGETSAIVDLPNTALSDVPETQHFVSQASTAVQSPAVDSNSFSPQIGDQSIMDPLPEIPPPSMVAPNVVADYSLSPLPEIPPPHLVAPNVTADHSLTSLPEIPPPSLLAGFLKGSFIPDSGPVTQLVNAITQSVQHHKIPVVIQENIHNAFCNIASQCKGDEFIGYDPQFINAMVQNYGPEAAIGVFAHEVGHAHHGISIPNIADWTDEMKADFFAGQILKKFNLNPEPFLRWLQNATADFRHPDGSTRFLVAQKGYMSAAA